MTPRTFILAAFLPGTVAACASAPDFPAGDAANAPFPKIVPISEIQAQVVVPPGDEGIAELAARAADLRARADALRGTTVVDEATEEQMQDALSSS
ncbi:hypothetical protein GCM10016455_12310 [Aliiroseovarius zhejiangensis]|uniref:DUF3035 domain-containing protein n=1 Tax=Aliiroseovarius zhejiangensis TaxID=1632025 RepID=A0ABQ3ITW0_9RHOB|nr:hypothetical protein [Aliiroseovarius zhejiangensis]GHE93665.1 hypothetical protein GCM10016455_12310 [Aliiroseovarius zhejiangensis]